MDLVSRPLTAKALLSHPGQVLTSLDLAVIKWKTKGYTLNHLQDPLQSKKKIYFVDATDVLLMSFLSEDLIVPPHELLKWGMSQLEYKSGICPFSNLQNSCVHLESFVPCIVSITVSILFILNLSKDFCRCMTV